jgi:hypothetical protein
VARALLLVLLLIPGTSLAKATGEVPYALGDVYSTALRFVRIDKGCKVIDRDPDAAFVTFECKDDDKTKRGSMEMFRSGGKQEGVRVQLALGDDPHYMELRWLELLERKLRDERGTPPPPPAAAPPKTPPPPDGGT